MSQIEKIRVENADMEEVSEAYEVQSNHCRDPHAKPDQLAAQGCRCGEGERRQESRGQHRRAAVVNLIGEPCGMINLGSQPNRLHVQEMQQKKRRAGGQLRAGIEETPEQIVAVHTQKKNHESRSFHDKATCRAAPSRGDVAVLQHLKFCSAL
jgi:hypothetical protein